VAFVAVTVSVDELPEEIDMGIAVIVTIGAGLEVPVRLPPQPVISRNRDKLDTNVAEKRVRLIIQVHILACRCAPNA
jgi:hypothetical protein